jgi:Flp pilus assembly protein TadG
MRLLKRLTRRRDNGQAMVEFAMLAPVFFLLFFGIAEAGMLFNAWVSVQDASERGARYAITGRDTCSSSTGGGRMGCIVSESKEAFSHYDNTSGVNVTVKSWRFPTYTSVKSNDPGKPCDAVEVSVSYTYVPKIPLVGTNMGGSINLTGRQRFISEPFAACTAN